MGLAASHAAMAAPMQAVTEIGLGILLVIGLLTRPAAFVAFLYLGSLWVSEWGTSLDLGTAGFGARIARACSGEGRSCVGCRRLAGAALAILPMVVN